MINVNLQDFRLFSYWESSSPLVRSTISFVAPVELLEASYGKISRSEAKFVNWIFVSSVNTSILASKLRCFLIFVRLDEVVKNIANPLLFAAFTIGRRGRLSSCSEEKYNKLKDRN